MARVVLARRARPQPLDLDWPLIDAVAEALGLLERDPQIGYALRGRLHGLRSLRPGTYRIIYQLRRRTPARRSRRCKREALEQRTRLQALADPRAHARLPARGRLGAANTGRQGRVPAPGCGDRRGRSLAGSSRAARALWAIRWKIGELLGWDDPDAGIGSRVPTLRGRFPSDLQHADSGPAFDSLPFTSLYLLDDEWAAEIANQTVPTPRRYPPVIQQIERTWRAGAGLASVVSQESARA